MTLLSDTSVSSGLDVVIPVYLDANTLLDVLASIEGGYQTVERTVTETSSLSTTSSTGGIGVGFASILSFFKLQGADQESQGEKSESERYHTMGSLLNRLRGLLAESDSFVPILDEASWQRVKLFDFVEFHGTFEPNPLHASVDRVQNIVDLGIAATEFQQPVSAGTTKQRRTGQQSDLARVTSLLQSIVGIKEEEGPAMLYVVSLTEPANHRVVMSLFPDLVRDRRGTELPGGHFRVLGKVARKIAGSESVDLLRGTRLFGMSDEMISGLLEAFETLGKAGFKLPTLETAVSAPALQVIPIAVYV